MLQLIELQRKNRNLEVLCIAAHSDDIEIGAGATLLELQRRYPKCVVHWAIVSADGARRNEALKSMRAFIAKPRRGFLRTGALPDAEFPAHVSEVKEFVRELRQYSEPDVIFAPHLADRHQDHRLVAEIVWQVFRSHLILEYEIAKYEGDLTTPNVYVPVCKVNAQRKVKTLMRVFASQRNKYWFSEDLFFALLRLRGVECRAPDGLAEGFHCRKAVLDFHEAMR